MALGTGLSDRAERGKYREDAQLAGPVSIPTKLRYSVSPAPGGGLWIEVHIRAGRHEAYQYFD